MGLGSEGVRGLGIRVEISVQWLKFLAGVGFGIRHGAASCYCRPSAAL